MREREKQMRRDEKAMRDAIFSRHFTKSPAIALPRVSNESFCAFPPF
jgi:hypothetical protein